MSWNNCRKCMFLPRTSFTSSLFKVLLTLKLLHGSRSGAKGSTLEDIAMHMIKHFCLDGDIKSQVLASLKYGVKMHFIQKKKEKFSLIIPASSIHLAPCKFKNEEMERINCIFPPTWYSNSGGDPCGGGGESTCGKRKRGLPNVCCQDTDEESDEGGDPCNICKAKRSKSTSSKQGSSKGASKGPCPVCSKSRKKKHSRAPCPKPKPPVCARKKHNKSQDLYDNYCQMCSYDDTDAECNAGFNYEAHKNCSCCLK